MAKEKFEEIIDQICQKDQRYCRETYSFVREGLDYTLKTLKKQNGSNARRHVTGQELLIGLREYALKEFGPMTKTVLNEWGIRSCEDFGEVVFNLVDSGILGKTEHDSRNDFKNGYNFDEAFVHPFRPKEPLPLLNSPAPEKKRSPRAIRRKKNSKKQPAD
ncbi:MAG: hypothetical protein NZM04_10990 [Methylacidiphilales bacterium]|nr:hypothetical protein [Candidatus Methylacidiphilales bacterium]MDW8349940.1 hypothetical protein [Verrucomicrobiae bacterium]